MIAGYSWTTALVGQLQFYWEAHLWPRLQGLSDDEYFWAPAPGGWTVREVEPGRWVPDSGPVAEGEPSPVTTIAWRLAHIAVGCFATRASTFFGDGSVPEDADMFDPRHRPASLPGTADEALAYLHRSYTWWHDGIAGLSETELLQPLGPRGSWFGADPMAELILHVNREVMHHGGEIGLLRDLYPHRTS
jgi:hypothetical protein